MANMSEEWREQILYEANKESAMPEAPSNGRRMPTKPTKPGEGKPMHPPYTQEVKPHDYK